MYDHILIYVIVVLNMLCQHMLIWRLKSLEKARWFFIGIAAALPLVVMAVMRMLVAGGMIHGRLAEQSPMESVLTQASSMLLLAGPWLMTAAAILCNRRRKVAGLHA